MTHEELLANINDQEFAYDTLANALRAVVELHMPQSDEDWTLLDNPTIGCGGCGYDYQYDVWNYRWPCDTINAIQRELN